MSLQVWLPLNGDLHNQGLSDVTVTNNGATVDTAGKIGSCYSFDGSDDFISTVCSNYPTILSGNFSLALWFYNDDSGSRSVLFGDYGLTGAFKFNIEKTAGEKLRVYWNDGRPDWNSSQTILPVSTWSHIVITKNEDTFYSYLNGTLVDSYTNVPNSTVPTTATTFYFGRDNRTGAIALKGKLNDLRIYDHCLSPKEVKELSKGLIAHYPLNDGVGGENLLYNSLTLPDTDWSSSSGDGYLKTDNDYLGFTSRSWDFTTGTSGHKELVYSKRDNSSYVIPVSANEKYTVSFWAKGTRIIVYFYNNNTGVQAIASERKTNADLYDAGSGKDGATYIQLTDEWKHYWITWTFDSNTTSLKKCLIFRVVYGNKASVCGIKLEKGSVATPWIPNPNDELYSAMGLDNGICYDTSGYGHNGEYHNTTKVTTDTPRYSIAPLWESGVANNVTVYDIQTTNLNTSFTVSCWAYLNGDGKMPWCCIGGNNLNLYVSGGKFYYNTFDGANNPFQDSSGTVVPATQYLTSWHHYTVTGDGTTAKLYVDGVYLGSAKTWKPFNATGFSINGPNNANYKARSVSDIRIYATALSAEDIKQLYEVSASIDNTGNVYGSEVVE